MIERKQSKFEKALSSLKDFLFLKEDKLYQKLLSKVDKDNNNKVAMICYFDNNLNLVDIHLSELNNSQEIWNISVDYYYFIIEGDLFTSILNQLQMRKNHLAGNILTEKELSQLDDELNIILNSELKSYLDNTINYFVSQINSSVGVIPQNTNHFVISSNFLTPNLTRKVMIKLKLNDELALTISPELTNETTFKDIQQNSLYSLFEKFNPEFVTEKERYLKEWVNSEYIESYPVYTFINSIGPTFKTYQIMSDKVKESGYKESSLANLSTDHLKFHLLHLLLLKDKTKIIEELRDSGMVKYLVSILKTFFEFKGYISLLDDYYEQTEFLELFTVSGLDCASYYSFDKMFSKSDFNQIQEWLVEEVAKEFEIQFSELIFNIDVDKHFKSTSDINESKFDFQKLLELILSRTNLKLKICFDNLKSYFTETDSEGEVISYHLRDFTNLHEEFGERVTFEAQPIDVEALEYYKLGAEKGFIKKDSLGEINLLLPLLKQ